MVDCVYDEKSQYWSCPICSYCFWCPKEDNITGSECPRCEEPAIEPDSMTQVDSGE
jgi:hypothetical protein